MIQGAKTIIEYTPVDQSRQPDQLMVHVDLVVKVAAEQFGVVWIPVWMRIHLLPTKLQENDDQLYRFL